MNRWVILSSFVGKLKTERVLLLLNIVGQPKTAPINLILL